MGRWHLNIWCKDFVRDSLVKAMWSQSLLEELSNHHVRTIDNDIDVASCETKIFQILTQCSVKVRPGISAQKMAILGSAPRNFLWKIDQKRQVRPPSPEFCLLINFVKEIESPPLHGLLKKLVKTSLFTYVL